MFEKLLPFNLNFKQIEGRKNIATDCFSRLCSKKLDKGLISKQYVPAMIAACKKVANWGEEVREDVLKVVRRGREDQRYINLLEDIKEDVEPKFTKPDAILREFADSVVLTRLGVEEVGKNLKVAVLDTEAVSIPPSMEKEVLDTRGSRQL